MGALHVRHRFSIRPSNESSRWLQSRWVSSLVIYAPCKVPPLQVSGTRATRRWKQALGSFCAAAWKPSLRLSLALFICFSNLLHMFLVHGWKKRRVDFQMCKLASKLVKAFELQTYPIVFCPLQTKDVKVRQEIHKGSATPPVSFRQFCSNFQEAATPWSKSLTNNTLDRVKLSDLEILLLPEISLSARQPEAAFTTWNSTGIYLTLK